MIAHALGWWKRRRRIRQLEQMIGNSRPFGHLLLFVMQETFGHDEDQYLAVLELHAGRLAAAAQRRLDKLAAITAADLEQA